MPATESTTLLLKHGRTNSNATISTRDQTYGTTSSAHNVTASSGHSKSASTQQSVMASNHATPVLSRPIASRSNPNIAQSLRPHLHRASTAPPKRPSMLRNFASAVFGIESSSTSHPDEPTYWSDHVHKQVMLQLWDTHSQSSQSESDAIVIERVKIQMIQAFSELGVGEQVLDRKFIEFLLGLNLRHPWCTAGTMSRWEVLSASGGARANWGPW